MTHMGPSIPAAALEATAGRHASIEMTARWALPSMSRLRDLLADRGGMIGR